MIFAALNEAAERGELLLAESGLCRFHRRCDGVVVIREIVVLPGARRNGVGSALVGRVAALNPGALIRARCPAAYVAANAFWPALGFRRAEAKADGIDVWERFLP